MFFSVYTNVARPAPMFGSSESRLTPPPAPPPSLYLPPWPKMIDAHPHPIDRPAGGEQGTSRAPQAVVLSLRPRAGAVRGAKGRIQLGAAGGLQAGPAVRGVGRDFGRLRPPLLQVRIYLCHVASTFWSDTAGRRSPLRTTDVYAALLFVFCSLVMEEHFSFGDGDHALAALPCALSGRALAFLAMEVDEKPIVVGHVILAFIFVLGVSEI